MKSVVLLPPEVQEKLLLRRKEFVVMSVITKLTLNRFHDNSSTDISSTTLRLQTFRLQGAALH